MLSWTLCITYNFKFTQNIIQIGIMNISWIPFMFLANILLKGFKSLRLVNVNPRIKKNNIIRSLNRLDKTRLAVNCSQLMHCLHFVRAHLQIFYQNLAQNRRLILNCVARCVDNVFLFFDILGNSRNILGKLVFLAERLPVLVRTRVVSSRRVAKRRSV